jgi:hypothetical protein
VPDEAVGCEDTGEEWLQLARLEFLVGFDGRVDGEMTVDETQRPVLVPTRVLQGGR